MKALAKFYLKRMRPRVTYLAWVPLMLCFLCEFDLHFRVGLTIFPIAFGAALLLPALVVGLGLDFEWALPASRPRLFDGEWIACLIVGQLMTLWSVVFYVLLVFEVQPDAPWRALNLIGWGFLLQTLFVGLAPYLPASSTSTYIFPVSALAGLGGITALVVLRTPGAYGLPSLAFGALALLLRTGFHALYACRVPFEGLVRRPTPLRISIDWSVAWPSWLHWMERLPPRGRFLARALYGRLQYLMLLASVAIWLLLFPAFREDDVLASGFPLLVMFPIGTALTTWVGVELPVLVCLGRRIVFRAAVLPILGLTLLCALPGLFPDGSGAKTLILHSDWPDQCSRDLGLGSLRTPIYSLTEDRLRLQACRFVYERYGIESASADLEAETRDAQPPSVVVSTSPLRGRLNVAAWKLRVARVLFVVFLLLLGVTARLPALFEYRRQWTRIARHFVSLMIPFCGLMFFVILLHDLTPPAFAEWVVPITPAGHLRHFIIERFAIVAPSLVAAIVGLYLWSERAFRWLEAGGPSIPSK